MNTVQEPNKPVKTSYSCFNFKTMVKECSDEYDTYDLDRNRDLSKVIVRRGNNNKYLAPKIKANNLGFFQPQK